VIPLALLAFTVAHAEPPRAEVIAGWSGGPSRAYGYLQAQPAIGRNEVAGVGLRMTTSFLRYEVVTAEAPDVHVDSPGVELAAAFKYTPEHVTLGMATGIEARRTERVVPPDPGERRRDLDLGATLSIDTRWLPDPRVAASAIGRFSGANRYFWGRVGAQRQVVPLYRHEPATSLWLGADVTGQGNYEVRSVEGGVSLELAVSAWKTSFAVRAEFGTEDVGDTTRPSSRLGGGIYRWF
jgi:hypothetical protein